MTHKHVIKELKAVSSPEKAEHSKRFFRTGPGEYGEGDQFLGITVPEQRKIAKKYKSISLSEAEILLQNPFHEVRLTVLMLLVYKLEKADEELSEEIFNLYMSNLQYVNNWDLVDSSCRFIIGKYLEHKEKDLLFDMARSNDLWEKRIAMISCYHFIHNRHEFGDALIIAEILVNDDHDLIQKAVGWMLREIGNVDQELEEEFLRKHYKQMPRTMLRYAIEKFEEPLRKKYLHGEI